MLPQQLSPSSPHAQFLRDGAARGGGLRHEIFVLGPKRTGGKARRIAQQKWTLQFSTAKIHSKICVWGQK